MGLLLLLSVGKGAIGDGSAQGLRRLHILAAAVLSVSAAAAIYIAVGTDYSFTLFSIVDGISIAFKVDAISRIYVTFISVIWLLIGIYAFSYMKHEAKERRFFAFYIMAYGVLVALSFAENLVTFYFFYEWMTVSTMPLVFHNESHEAIVASLKYLFYSMFGAYCVLFGIYFLYRYCGTLSFTAGGTLDAALVSGHEPILLIVVFVMILGFGVKAGMFPMHAWLPSAHPVAPAPASAALSGIIVKAGVLGIIRVVFYVVGADFIRGTWVQTVWRVLALITVFMGSMLAYREPVFKKRLAYSTVSQVSYILFGLSMLNETAFEGAVMQIVFHAVMKSALFLVAGSFIFKTGNTRAAEYRGIGKKMPVTLWSYAFASLALIGIPPTCGFIGKWYLAGGAIESGMAGYAYAAVLLVSALLTAGYLLPVVMDGFFPGKAAAGKQAAINAQGQAGCFAPDGSDTELREKAEMPGMDEAPVSMVVPVVILAAATVILGLFPNPLADYVSGIAAAVLGR
ncbi:MAG: proton-conducting membrane transporter [Clostridiales bacterium]|nr:proton-conducting membrane transporter [Clostridiales bacterium]